MNQKLQEQLEQFYKRVEELRLGLRTALNPQVNEGGLSHFGLYWLDPVGTSHLVNDIASPKNTSHEDAFFIF
jgi:hypothetical protein